MVKLKSKITRELMVVALTSILLTSISLGIAFWFILNNEVKDDLEVYTKSITSSVDCTKTDNVKKLLQSGYRITLVDKNGNVLFESETKDQSIYSVNHKDRPEISKAIENGTGESSRMSDTSDEYTYYYAVRIENGNVLRVSKKISSILNVYMKIIPVVICVLIYILAICLVLSAELIKRIIKPIEKMSEDIDKVAYEELVPFASTIKEQQKHINSQMDEVLKIDKIKQEFTANVSHELKTPLTSISGYAEMIENGMVKNDEDVQLFAKKIHKEAGRLVTLIGDIIELSQLDGSDFVKNITPINLLALAKECAEDLEINACKNNIKIKVEGVNAVINGDRKNIYELIYNLCDNAIRYNKENGTVTITVADDKRGISVCVEDTGIGIPQKYQSRVFERFYRVDKSRSKKTGGTGLGLAIVKHIAEQHNAKIEIESTYMAGTKITVIF